MLEKDKTKRLKKKKMKDKEGDCHNLCADVVNLSNEFKTIIALEPIRCS